MTRAQSCREIEPTARRGGGSSALGTSERWANCGVRQEAKEPAAGQRETGPAAARQTDDAAREYKMRIPGLRMKRGGGGVSRWRPAADVLVGSLQRSPRRPAEPCMSAHAARFMTCLYIRSLFFSKPVGRSRDVPGATAIVHDLAQVYRYTVQKPARKTVPRRRTDKPNR